MATNRDLLKEAIADAKAVKETAIANAKAALEEAFTPYLKEKLSAKLTEMDENELTYETELDKLDEMGKEDEMANEEISLDELLAELDAENEGIYEAEDSEAGEEEGEEEEMSIEDMSEDDLKHFIEDVIKDMVSAGELEAGHEGMENEEGAEEMEMDDEEEMDMEADEDEINIDELLAEMEVDEAYAKKATDPSPKSKNAIHHKGKDEYKTPGSQEKETPYSKGEATKVSFEEDLNELSDVYLTQAEAIVSALVSAGVVAAAALSVEEVRDALAKKGNALKTYLKSKISGSKETTDEQLDELRSELNEVNLLNAKLLYTNKIFRNKSLNETQKVKVLTAFDKATSKKEVELVYETLLESLKVTTKAPIKESMGSASKVLGGTTSKPIIENDAFSRMRELAFGNKK